MGPKSKESKKRRKKVVKEEGRGKNKSKNKLGEYEGICLCGQYHVDLIDVQYKQFPPPLSDSDLQFVTFHR
jgi:hypothetical protein